LGMYRALYRSRRSSHCLPLPTALTCSAPLAELVHFTGEGQRRQDCPIRCHIPEYYFLRLYATYFTTLYLISTLPGDSITPICSSSISSLPNSSKNRSPSPSSTGAMPISISSASPARMHCRAVSAPPITVTSFSPAAAFACA